MPVTLLIKVGTGEFLTLYYITISFHYAQTSIWEMRTLIVQVLKAELFPIHEAVSGGGCALTSRKQITPARWNLVVSILIPMIFNQHSPKLDTTCIPKCMDLHNI